MDLANLKMAVNTDGFLTPNEEIILLDAYYNLFSRMFGKDIPTSLIQVLKLDKSQPLYSKLLSISENYKNAQNALTEIKPNIKGTNLNMLMVYDNNILIAVARLRNLSDSIGCIPDAVFMVSEDIMINLWPLMIDFCEEYFKNLGYKKMYIEVPLYNPQLLKGCFDRNFREDPEDIVIKESTRTYYLNKNLERKRV